ncbi:DUF6318 family protein [Glutamicibacter protophormiae]
MSARKIACVALLAAGSIALAACDSGSTAPPTQTPSQGQDETTKGTTQSSAPASTLTGSQSKQYRPATADGPAKNVPFPKKPGIADEKSEKGSIAFLKHYLAVMNYTFETYDSSSLEKLTSDNCKLCYQNIIQGVQFNSAQGGWQVGGQYEYKVYSSKLDNSTALLGFSMHKNQSTLYKSTGEVANEQPEQIGNTHAVAVLKYKNSWIVDSISINEKP